MRLRAHVCPALYRAPKDASLQKAGRHSASCGILWALALILGLGPVADPGAVAAQSPLEFLPAAEVSPAGEEKPKTGKRRAPQHISGPFKHRAFVSKNALYVEFGGASGDRMSINYERALWREARFSFVARAGLFYYQPKAGDKRWTTPSNPAPAAGPKHAGDLILGLHTVYGAYSRHRLETGINLNVRWQRENGVTRYGTQNLASAQIGYRLLPRGGKGFLFRANAMLVHEPPYNWLQFALEGEKIPAKVLPWAGISVGYAF